MNQQSVTGMKKIYRRTRKRASVTVTLFAKRVTIDSGV
jgi:hypothetical protein